LRHTHPHNRPGWSARTIKQAQTRNTELSSIKAYFVNQTGELKDAAAKLKTASDTYYDLAKSANFDYAAF
jgi:hypothetical protein